MKRDPLRHPWQNHPGGGRGGVALVLVLSILVILSVLVLAFFVSVRTESSTSNAYAVALESRKYADEALNLVTAQIGDATSQANVTWVSQPGLIRTFNTSGKLDTAYKLYSAASLRETGAFDPTTTGDIPPADWYGSPGLFTDLNAPAYLPDANGAVTIGGDKFRAVYPIVDPAAAYDATNNPGGVHGFSITAPPLEASSTAVNPAPMPARWIYVLRDGTLAAGATGNAGVVNVSAATTNNPVMGRFAFWTDDDTCKVNVNTAGGDLWTPEPLGSGSAPGSFADMPHMNTTQDQNLAKYQPVNREFQRYPGHPATTYLSAVFPFLDRPMLAALAPKIVVGGSKGGTVAATNALSPDKDRLYASADELFYSASYDAMTAPDRLPNTTTVGPLDRATVARTGFFITAHSRAPEVNLFNRPRVTIWPEAADATKRTTFDKTIAFCATVGANPFHFVRSNCNSSTDDFLGFPRNQSLYGYLEDLTGDASYASAIPGFGGNFKAKYGDDRDQILTEIFDYIRCTNLADVSPGATRYVTSPSSPTVIPYCPPGTGQVVPIEISAPRTNVQTRGFGRMPTVHSPTLLIYPTRYVPDSKFAPQNNGNVREVRAVFLIESFTVSHGVMRLLPNLVYEVEGLDSLTIDGKALGFPNKARVTYGAVSPYHDYGWGSLEGAANLFWPGAKKLGPNPATDYTLFSQKVAVSKYVYAEYPPFTYEGAFASYLTLACPNVITMRVFTRDKLTDPAALPLQTLQFQFPQSSNIPTPRVYTGNPGTLPSSPVPPAEYVPGEDFSIRAHSTAELYRDTYPRPSDGSQTATLSENDSVRSMEPTTGDARLIAGMKDVPAAAFQKDADYDRKVLFASDMRCGNQLAYAGQWGKLVAGANYPYYNPTTFCPAVPSFVTAANLLDSAGNRSPGDWDTGMGSVSDGPYINKPDEGEIGGNNPYFTYDGTPVQASLFSPNRQVPSPVIFGSLSTGVKASQAAFAANDPSRVKPWQTLLFCPNPAAKTLHPGRVTPPDHLFLDLFTMPVVEPYPISEPFSTAGKINLNYQIVPFPYLTRNTGVQAVLKSTRVTAIPTADVDRYKSGNGNGNYRLEIDPDETLKGFDDRFANNKPFISASEICDMFLVPKGATWSGIANWWDTYALTGDNLREKPYADLYSRLTTKSNTFTVHVRAQSLQKRIGTPAGEWTEGKDVVTSEYRGSFTLERFLNPNITSYDEKDPLTDYKFRVVETKQFAP